MLTVAATQVANIVMQALLYNLLPAYQLYGHKHLALFLSVGQTLLPMLDFWVLRGGWIGFFLGQMAVAIVILVATTILRRKNRMLTPVLLIPKTNKKKVYDVTIETNIEALAESMHDVLVFLQSQGLTKEAAHRYVLCAEELVGNIIEHGHARYIDIRATSSIITLHDDGRAFNPLEYKGDGFGLKIVNCIGIDMKYDYRFNQNMLTIIIQYN